MTEKGEQGASAIRTIAPGRGVVVLRDQTAESARIVSLVLDHVVRRQAALAATPAHRAARRLEADPQLPRGLDLDVDQTLLAAREEVEVVRRRGAAGEQKLAEPDARRGGDSLLVDPTPDLVEASQPQEERRLLHPGHVARERLREVVVGVDEPGQHDLAASVQASEDVHGGRLARAHRLDALVLDEHPAVCVA